MSGVIESLERAQLRSVPPFQPGDRVKVHFQVVEGNRRRTQVFEGTVIKRQGSGARETFTARKQSFGVGVERTFPVHSPKIERIEVASRGDVRRAKLYYLRGRVGRRARVRERQYTGAEARLAELEISDAQGVQEPIPEADAGEEPPAEEVPAAEDAAAEAQDVPPADEAAPAEAPAAEEAPPLAEEAPPAETPADESPSPSVSDGEPTDAGDRPEGANEEGDAPREP